MVTVGKTSPNSREFGQRVSWFWQWLLMASCGASIGWITGGAICELLFLMFLKSAPDDWGFTMIQSLSGIYEITPESIALSVQSVIQIGKFGFSIAFGLVLLHGQQLFVEILRIKLTHRILFFLIRRRVKPEEFNVFSDYVWAILYCVAQGLLPWVVFVVLFFVGLSLIPRTIDFMWVAMGAGMAGAVAASKAQEFVYQILYPHRLIQEIEQAKEILILLQQEEDEKRRRDELKGRD